MYIATNSRVGAPEGSDGSGNKDIEDVPSRPASPRESPGATFDLRRLLDEKARDEDIVPAWTGEETRKLTATCQYVGLGSCGVPSMMKSNLPGTSRYI